MAAEAKARSSDLARGLAAGASVGAAQRSASARWRLLGACGRDKRRAGVIPGGFRWIGFRKAGRFGCVAKLVFPGLTTRAMGRWFLCGGSGRVAAVIRLGMCATIYCQRGDMIHSSEMDPDIVRSRSEKVRWVYRGVYRGGREGGGWLGQETFLAVSSSAVAFSKQKMVINISHLR